MNATDEGVVHVTDIPHGSVVITPAQMYEEMRGVRDEVKHLSSILDPTVAELRADVADNKAEIRAVKSDLKTLWSRVWFASGFAAGLGALGGFTASSLFGG